MKKSKIKPLVFSVFGAIIISILFLMICFWIFYTYAASPVAAKDALSTKAGFFGGVATLWAACIAAYLFNDWQSQHNKQIEAKFITTIIDNFDCFNITLNQLFQFRPEKLEIILASDLDYFLDECQKLDLLIRTLEKSYMDYHIVIAHTPPLERQQIFINIKRSFSYLNKENNKQEQKKNYPR